MSNRIILLFLGIVLSLKLTAQSSDWSPAGIPIHGRSILCMYTDTVNNVFYVTGQILKTPTDFSSFYIARYDGISWDTIGGFNQQIFSLAVYNGDLIACGSFTTINGNPIYTIAKFDGSNWSALGNFDDQVNRVKVIGTDLYAVGSYNLVNGTTAHGVAKWNGTVWTDVNAFPGDPTGHILFDIALYKGNIYISGNFQAFGLKCVAVFKGGSWQNINGGILGSFAYVYEMATYKDELYFSGMIMKSAGNTGHMIQKWNDTIWSEVGGSVRDYSGGYNLCQIFDILVYEDNLYVGGGFGYAGNIPAAEIARWDGEKWCNFGTDPMFSTGFGTGGVLALGIFNDTLYLGIANDTVNGVHTDRCIKYLDGITVDSCSMIYTAVDEVVQNNELSIYPNPACCSFTIELDLTRINNCSIEIKNTLGQTVKSIAINESSNGKHRLLINIQDLTAGVYLLQVMNDGKVYTKKLLKH
jgi:hypothetical protein